MASDYAWLKDLLTGPEIPSRAAAFATGPGTLGTEGALANRVADLMFRLSAESLRSLEPALDASSPLLSSELHALEQCADALVLLAAGTLRP